jgi:hypothetical protein
MEIAALHHTRLRSQLGATVVTMRNAELLLGMMMQLFCPSCVRLAIRCPPNKLMSSVFDQPMSPCLADEPEESWKETEAVSENGLAKARLKNTADIPMVAPLYESAAAEMPLNECARLAQLLKLYHLHFIICP